ncbi:prepilin peptidase [Paenibacillaceae bacterium WGS1546]|uniref:prepilin peptidase n=1 Tax=Cohnella sp. WGS1546 TaxID=3366810 RepID=UPI00372D259C
MPLEHWAMTAVWFAAGIVFGSFFVVVGIRLPVRRSIVRPPSACPHCGQRIRGVDLWPVVGWMLRLSKCRHCKAPISPLYPLMELATGVCFAVLYLRGSSLQEWAAGIALASLLIVLAVSDLKYRLLPNRLVYPGLAACLLYRLVVHPLPLWQYGLGFLIGGGILWLVSWAGLRMNRPAMGGGDIKLMSMLGLLLGAEQILFVVLVSSALGLAIGLLLMALGRMSRQAFLPFGPFIGLAGFLSWVYGERVVDWYLSYFVLA